METSSSIALARVGVGREWFTPKTPSRIKIRKVGIPTPHGETRKSNVPSPFPLLVRLALIGPPPFGREHTQKENENSQSGGGIMKAHGREKKPSSSGSCSKSNGEWALSWGKIEMLGKILCFSRYVFLCSFSSWLPSWGERLKSVMLV